MTDSKITSEENVQSSPPYKNRVVLYCVIFVGMIALSIIVLDSITTAWEKMVRMGCIHNLAQISVKCREYAATNNGCFPTKWSDLNLVGDDANWAKLLKCPTVRHDIGDWSKVDLWADYRLLPGRTTNDPNDRILAIEPLANHKSEGANVLFVDGSTAWWPKNLLINSEANPLSTQLAK